MVATQPSPLTLLDDPYKPSLFARKLADRVQKNTTICIPEQVVEMAEELKGILIEHFKWLLPAAQEAGATYANEVVLLVASSEFRALYDQVNLGFFRDIPACVTDLRMAGLSEKFAKHIHAHFLSKTEGDALIQASAYTETIQYIHTALWLAFFQEKSSVHA